MRASRKTAAGSGELIGGEGAYQPHNCPLPRVDSSATRSPVVAPAETPAVEAGVPAADAVPPGALARLGRLIPGAEAVARFAYRVAGASVVAAGLVVWAVVDAVGWTDVSRGPLVALGLLLLLPAAATALAGWTLADLARLPGQLRDAALSAAREAGDARTAKGSRLVRLVRSLWAARGLALLTKGGWVKAVGALRFLRLASLPFALALVGAVALNAVVIVAGVVAVLVLLF